VAAYGGVSPPRPLLHGLHVEVVISRPVPPTSTRWRCVGL
jgi:hypothetical protein